MNGETWKRTSKALETQVAGKRLRELVLAAIPIAGVFLPQARLIRIAVAILPLIEAIVAEINKEGGPQEQIEPSEDRLAAKEALWESER